MRAPPVPWAEAFSSVSASAWSATMPAPANSEVQMAADSVSLGMPFSGSPMKQET